MKSFCICFLPFLQRVLSLSSPSQLQSGSGMLGLKIIPANAATGSVHANFVSNNGNLDGPQLSAINTTSFDWWYFDVVSSDLQTSLTIVFFSALDSAFPYLNTGCDVVSVAVSYSTNDGDGGFITLDANKAIVATIEDGSSGFWEGAGASWVGAPDMSHYEIVIDSPTDGVVGTFSLKSLAPAHYACGPVVPGVSMQALPHIGWSNALPDATGTVDMTIDGRSLNFDGIAYHDQNWGDQPLENSITSWYWGHARLGPYSLVWFDGLAINGSEYVSAYVSKNGAIITTSCQPNSVKVRPVGTEYPPSISSTDSSTYTIEMNLGTQGILKANISIVATIADAGPSYKRWTGSIIGTLRNGSLITGGTALFEQFKLKA